MRGRGPTRRELTLWLCGGSALLFLCVALTLVSTGFEYRGGRPVGLVLAFMAVLVSSGAVFVTFFWKLKDRPGSAGTLALIVIFGLAMRAVLMVSVPVYEDDFYRYLWDGALTARGVSPYRHAPAEFQGGSVDAPAELLRLAEDSGVVIERINHPPLRTIYPPVAQGVFALAHLVRPWSIFSLRAVFFLFDAASMALILLILRRLSLPFAWSAIWWWNPLVLKEVYNSTHMDVIVVPLVLGALYMAITRRHVAAAALLALGVGVKLWPIILLPVLLRGALDRPVRLLGAIGVFLILSAIIFLPVAAGGLDEHSGFAAYGRHWEMNDALYMAVLWAARGALSLLGAQAVAAHIVARAAAGAALVAVILYLCRMPVESPRDLARRCMWVVAALFLLSPTQFPWYYIWVIPFVAFAPRLSLLMLGALLPLYYLRFYFKSIGHTGVFDYGIVFLEYVPFWVLLFWEWRRGRGAPAQPVRVGGRP